MMRKILTAALLCSAAAAHADSLNLGIGKGLNNDHRAPARLWDVAARKSNCIGTLECQASFTSILRSDFGGRDGGEQIVTAGVLQPWNLKHEWTLRAGGGVLVAVHFPVPENNPDLTFATAQCLFCGYFLQGSLEWRTFEAGLRYIATDPNSWPSHNGLLLVMSYNIDWGKK